MALRHWVSGVCALSAIAFTVVGCGGGNSVLGAYPSALFSGSSDTRAANNPTITNVGTNADGQTTATVVDVGTGVNLGNVVIPTPTAFRPVSGQPALVFLPGSTQFGGTFGRSRADNWVTLYHTDVSGDPNPSSANEVLRARVDDNGALLDPIAVGGTSGRFTLRMNNVTVHGMAGRSLTMDTVNIVFEYSVQGGTVVTTFPTSFNANLPSFGELVTQDPNKTGWEAGGIQVNFGLDSVDVDMFVDHANGTFTRGASTGSGTTATILIGNGVTVMGDPCRRVDLKCIED